MLEEAAMYVLGGLVSLAGIVLTFSKVYDLIKTNILSGVEGKMEVATSETDLEIAAIEKTQDNFHKWMKNIETKVDTKTDVHRIERLEKKVDKMSEDLNQVIGKVGK